MDRMLCNRRTLAAGDFMLVEQCSCGSVHVTIGAVTLRLAAGALEPIASTIAEAARVLALQEASERLRPLAVLS